MFQKQFENTRKNKGGEGGHGPLGPSPKVVRFVYFFVRSNEEKSKKKYSFFLKELLSKFCY